MQIDFDNFYGEDYLKIYGEDLERRTQAEVEFIDSTLNLKPGAKVLDLFCGYGRHAILLGKLNYQIVGIETSQYLLDVGLKKIEEAKLKENISFLKLNPADINFSNEFDAVINMYTSFGFYESDEQNFNLIEKSYNMLKPGGKFLLDLVNREKVISLQPSKNWEEREGLFVLEAYNFNHLKGRAITRRIILSNGLRKEGYISIRLYTLAELKNSMENVGFKINKVYGDYDGSLYNSQSPRMIPLVVKSQIPPNR